MSYMGYIGHIRPIGPITAKAGGGEPTCES